MTMTFEDKIVFGLVGLSDQEEALRNPYIAYLFARYVKDANIEKCQEVVCKDSRYAYLFAKLIPGADILKSVEACKGSEFEGKLNEYLMEKALL